MDKYCLPPDYTHRINNDFFDDTPFTDQYQDEVYELARSLLDEGNYQSVLDIGAGSGFKLIKYFDDIETLGIDIEPTVSFLKKTYPDKNWGEIRDVNKEYDMVVCSDVIEHISFPDLFIESILELDFKVIIFSTPDRDSMYGPGTKGPPTNSAHVREWTTNEFNCYLSKTFNVVKQHKEGNTQIAICIKK